MPEAGAVYGGPAIGMNGMVYVLKLNCLVIYSNFLDIFLNENVFLNAKMCFLY